MRSADRKAAITGAHATDAFHAWRATSARVRPYIYSYREAVVRAGNLITKPLLRACGRGSPFSAARCFEGVWADVLRGSWRFDGARLIYIYSNVRIYVDSSRSLQLMLNTN